MSAVLENLSSLDLVEIPAKVSREVVVTPPPAGPMGSALSFLNAGGTMEQLNQMMELQDRWEANEARKAYNSAFSDFKAEAVRVIKAKHVTDGPLKGKSYAELYSVVDAVTPALSKHGLGASWKLTKDEPQWIEVTCTLKHILGHSEAVSMGGPPDAGGAKNAIQARASTVSYLERYTLKAVTGIAEGGQDDDGGVAIIETAKYDAIGTLREWSIRADSALNAEVLNKTRKMAGVEFNAGKDATGWEAFKKVVAAKVVQLNAEGPK